MSPGEEGGRRREDGEGRKEEGGRRRAEGGGRRVEGGRRTDRGPSARPNRRRSFRPSCLWVGFGANEAQPNEVRGGPDPPPLDCARSGLGGLRRRAHVENCNG